MAPSIKAKRAVVPETFALLCFSRSFQWSFCIYLIKSTSVLTQTSLKGLRHRERKQKSLLGGRAHPPCALSPQPSFQTAQPHPP